jgi:hypothetical protein
VTRYQTISQEPETSSLQEAQCHFLHHMLDTMTDVFTRTQTILHRSEHCCEPFLSPPPPRAEEHDTEPFSRAAPHLFDQMSPRRKRKKRRTKGASEQQRSKRRETLTRSMSRGSSSPERAPFPPPAKNSQRSRRARAVTRPAEARGAGRLRRIRVEIEGAICEEVKAAAAAAIGMRGSVPRARRRRRALGCVSGDSGNGKVERIADRRSNVLQGRK